MSRESGTGYPMRATDASLWISVSSMHVACVWSMCMIGVGRCQSSLHRSSTHRSHQVQSHPSRTGSLSAFPALVSPLHESPPPLRLLGHLLLAEGVGTEVGLPLQPHQHENNSPLYTYYINISLSLLSVPTVGVQVHSVVDRSTPGRHDRPPTACIASIILLWAFPDRCRTGGESLKRAGANRSALQCFDVLGKRRALSRFEIKQTFR